MGPVLPDDISRIISWLSDTSGGNIEIPAKVEIPARVTPIFKAKERTNMNNYCPISVLPVFSKIFENHIYSELSLYSETQNLISNQQCDFRLVTHELDSETLTSNIREPVG